MAAEPTDTGTDSSGVADSPATDNYVAPTAPSDPGKEDEEAQVKALWEEYEEAYDFDKNARKQFAMDRRYAAGNADVTWAVSANLIGSFIDILCSTLYAKDPDVSCKKAPQVSEAGTQKTEVFAETAELIVSRMWKDGRLKKTVRKQIRSTLSVGAGWFKAILCTEKVPQPTVTTALNDAKATHDRLVAAQEAIRDPDSAMSDDEMAVAKANVEQLMATLEAKIEKSVRKFMAIDFMPAQSVQVSLDVACTEDYLDADWNANYIFVPTKSLKVKFPKLTGEEVKTAKQYFQKKPRTADRTDQDLLTPIGSITAESADAYGTTNPGDSTASFAKIIELWDRRDMHVKTMVEGIKCWPVAPYAPPYASTRFYPYFRVAFYEIDDTRHPQSLAYRLHKLQDEYSCTRSNQRLTRERSIPGVIFNATQLADEEAKKLAASNQQELIGLKPLQPETPVANLFAPKPIGAYDPRLYDTTMILSDMDRLSGVQQAMQQAAASAQPKTATEASIEQAGAASRTGTDRDLLETMLTDFAQYTLECALQSLSIPEAQRIAGPGCFWPFGMDIDDLLNMVQIEIEAGTTGKPHAAGDQATWVQALPMVEQAIAAHQKATAEGNKPLADSIEALLRYTLKRFGDTTDVDSFIPSGPPPEPSGPPAPEVKISLSGQLDPTAALELAGLAPPGNAVAGPADGSGAGADGGEASGVDLSHNPALTLNPTHAPEHHVDNSTHIHIKPAEKTND